MNPVISVIVPTYNSEKTIERCLLSILKQTYENLEVIVVNDGSSDSTETICEKMASYDSRLKVITIKNGGVSHARIAPDFSSAFERTPAAPKITFLLFIAKL